MNAICFVTSRQYLRRLQLLIDSIKKHTDTKNISFHLLCCSDNNKKFNTEWENVIEYSLSEVFGENWWSYYTRYSHISGIGRVWIVDHLLNKGYNKVLYLDSDMLTYQSLEHLFNILKKKSAVVFPHITEPYPEDGKSPSMENIVWAGNYNSGLLGFSKTSKTLRFLSWWKSMCENKAEVDVSKGHYSEQNWLRFINEFLGPDCFVNFHSGYNLAHWNFYQRGLYKNENHGWYTKDGPLVVAHFSSLCVDTSWVSCNQNRVKLKPEDPMFQLVSEYKAMLPGQHWHDWKGGKQETKF